ncbi:hypothetical protein ACHAPX_006260 [Trichoderma viride]
MDDDEDWLSLGNKSKKHARIFVGKWHHSMHDDRYTQFKNTCPPNSASDFRTDDFYFWSALNLTRSHSHDMILNIAKIEANF